LRGWDQENGGLRAAQENSSQEPHLQNNQAKWTGGVVQEVEHLLCKHEALSSNSRVTKKKKKIVKRKKNI
jgi:hypothetical protein